jgi:hypothetical protein
MHLSNEKFLKRARRCVTIMGYRKFYKTNIECSRYKLKKKRDWDRFARLSYLPWYKGKHFSEPNAKNWSVREYALLYPIKLRRKKNIIIMTAYHPLLHKNLIIDGCHRAVAIDSLLLEEKPIPEVEIWECRGEQLHAIFPMDFQHFVVDALKK